jgi:NMD protein affecting ribosome stability and mRNA decay
MLVEQLGEDELAELAGCRACGTYRPIGVDGLCPECDVKTRLETGQLYHPGQGWLESVDAARFHRHVLWPYLEEG